MDGHGVSQCHGGFEVEAGERPIGARGEDITMASPLLDAAGPVRCLIPDNGYDADALRKRLQTEGAQAVIPGRSNRKAPIS